MRAHQRSQQAQENTSMDGSGINADHALLNAGPRKRGPRSEALRKILTRKRPKNILFDIRQVTVHDWSISHARRIRKDLDAVVATGGPNACAEVF